MSEKYIRRIIKRLKCSKSKREEIRRQLASEVLAEIENGEKIEDIMERMGSPAEIAEEFNNSFPDSERKKYRKEKRFTYVSITAIIILFLILLVYWALPKSIDLEDSKVFDKEAVQAKAEMIVQLLEDEDYEALQEQANETLKSVLTKETIEQARSNFGDDWGDFQAFGTIYLAEVKQMGKRNAVVQMNAAYENVSVTYTISFNEEMKLAGFWMK